MKPSVLILWNQVEEDIYEHWRAQGPKPLPWDPERTVPDVGTVAEEMARIVAAVRLVAERVWLVNIEDDLDRIIAAVRLYRPDVVMNLIEFFHDDASLEAHVAGLYELLGVAYTGSEPFALALCQNKYRTKLLLEAAGLPTSPYVLIEREPVPRDHELEFPLIVKPALEDASGGIEEASVVHDQAGLEARVSQVLKEFKMPALVEEYVDGREIHAAILGRTPPEVLPLFEMEFDDSEFNPDEEWRPQIISYRAKWDPHSPDFYSMEGTCPAQELDPELEEYIREVAAEAFKAVGCRDYARIDMRVDEEDGEAYILEVNPNPDLSDGAAYMECATASGRSFEQTIAEIIDMAWQRVRRARAQHSAQPTVAAGLPSDHLLREWVVQKRTGHQDVLPMAGGPSVESLLREGQVQTGDAEAGGAGDVDTLGTGVERGSADADEREPDPAAAKPRAQGSDTQAKGATEAGDEPAGRPRDSGHAPEPGHEQDPPGQ
ncbi:D-alanine--D-alanine ligase family protein [Haliangium sp.]|uniref:D-alanine--D-alanine ligase family protein n=1 Tax=Haliangium sp. TaxID=2663208 RepID=UPI003D0E1293